MSIADQLKDKIVNPKDLTSYNDSDTKSVITKREQVILSITRARQYSGYSEKEKRHVSGRELFFDSMIRFSRGVGGLALKYQSDATKSRVEKEDMQTSKVEQKE